MSEKISNNEIKRLSSFKKAYAGMIAINSQMDVLLVGSKTRKTTRVYTLKEVENIVANGSLAEQQELSRAFFARDGLYKRLIIYYSTLLKYTSILVPNPGYGKNLSTSHIKKKYFGALNFLEKASLVNKFNYIALKVFIDGCYYGVVQAADKDNLVIIDLPVGYCRSRFKGADGNDIIEINLSYFDSLLNDIVREQTLKAYPKAIRDAYYAHKKNGTSSWFMIPSELTLYFSLFDGYPLFVSTIPAIMRYDDAVDREAEREAEEIRKILVQHIPHMQDGRLIFEPEEAEEMHRGAVNMLKGNKNISVLTSYADVDAIVSKTTSEASANNLEKMVQNVYTETGVSSQIFASTGSSTLATSIKNDLGLVMVLANKFAAAITAIVNYLFANTNIDFKYTILPISYYNEDEYLDNAFKLASSGYSLLLPAITMGMSQKDIVNIKELENDVLNMVETLEPPRTSYTESNNVGAPKKSEEEKAPKTLQNEKSLDNQVQGGSNNE
jgi:hypothetical protein